MNRGQLSEYVRNVDTPNGDEALSLIIEKLRLGESVELRNFGTFEVVIRKAHPGTNPATGEKIQVAAKKVVKFKPSKHILG